MPTFKLEPIVGKFNLSQEAALRLRNAIKNREIPPGTHLVEQELAEQLGISRVPIREAIMQLVNEGLAIKEPRRGAYVHPYSRRELEEVYSVRVVLERLIVERVIANWTPKSYDSLKAIVDGMAEAERRDDRYRVYELDAQFHEMLWRMADHEVLLEVISSLRARISRFLFEANGALSPQALNHHVQLHYDLIEVFNKCNVKDSQEAISDHIMAARDRINEYYAYLDK